MGAPASCGADRRQQIHARGGGDGAAALRHRRADAGMNGLQWRARGERPVEVTALRAVISSMPTTAAAFSAMPSSRRAPCAAMET